MVHIPFAISFGKFKSYLKILLREVVDQMITNFGHCSIFSLQYSSLLIIQSTLAMRFVNFTFIFIHARLVLGERLISNEEEDRKTCDAGGYVCLPLFYNKYYMPVPLHNGTFTIDIFMKGITLRRVDDDTFSLALEIQTFSIIWTDPLVELKDDVEAKEMHYINKKMAKQIWTPHLSLQGSQTSSLEEQLEKGDTFLTEGKMSLWTSLPLRLWCEMKFRSFPLDKQVSYDLHLHMLCMSWY